MALFDFFFYDGEYQEEVSLGRDLIDYIDIFLDPILLIVTFILGYWISKLSFDRKEKRELMMLFNYFQAYLEDQTHTINRQIEGMEEQLKKVSQLERLQGLNIVIVTQPYFILDGINKEKLLKSLKQNTFNEDQLLITLKFIEYTKVAFTNYKDNHEKFNSRQREISKEWNQKILDFHIFKGEISKKPKKEFIESPDLMYINDIYNKWDKRGNLPLKNTIDNIVVPLEKYFKKVYSDNPNNNIALETIKKVGMINQVYRDWKHEVDAYKVYLEVMIPKIKKGLETLNEVSYTSSKQ